MRKEHLWLCARCSECQEEEVWSGNVEDYDDAIIYFEHCGWVFQIHQRHPWTYCPEHAHIPTGKDND